MVSLIVFIALTAMTVLIPLVTYGLMLSYDNLIDEMNKCKRLLNRDRRKD